MNNIENDIITEEIPLRTLDERNVDVVFETQDETVAVEEPFFCENGCYGHFTEIYNPAEAMNNFHINHPAIYYSSLLVFMCLILGVIVALSSRTYYPFFYDNKISEDK